METKISIDAALIRRYPAEQALEFATDCNQDAAVPWHNCLPLAMGNDIDQDLLLIAPGPLPKAIWVEGGSLLSSGSLTASSKTWLAVGADPITGIATDGVWIYYATTSPGSAAGVIYRVATLPGQVGGAIARGQLAPRSLATDGKRLFWSTADCAINALDL